jgi:hypothetical protein
MHYSRAMRLLDMALYRFFFRLWNDYKQRMGRDHNSGEQAERDDLY